MSTIDTGYVAVEKNMGVIKKELVEPGFKTYNPWTTQFIAYNTKQEIKTEDANPLTSDFQAIDIHYNVQYAIPRGKVIELASTISGDPYDTLVRPQIQEAFRQVVSQHKADFVIANVETVKAAVLGKVQASLHGLVSVNDIPIQRVELPNSLQKAINDKQRLEIEAKAKQNELEKQKKEAEITVVNARAEAEKTRMMNEALTKSPALVQYKLAEVELEKAKKWDGKLPDTIITGQNGFPFFNLKR